VLTWKRPGIGRTRRGLTVVMQEDVVVTYHFCPIPKVSWARIPRSWWGG
jgi:hypothetical protein